MAVFTDLEQYNKRFSDAYVNIYHSVPSYVYT